MIKNILKGAVIGLANIIPGVSGGTMAVSMGIYDKLIHCVTHIFSEFKKSMAFLLPIIIGAGLSLVGLSFVIAAAFEHFPMQTNFLFIGLIVGGLPMITREVKGKPIKPAHIIACLLFFLLVTGLAVIGEREGASADLSLNFVNILKFLGVGMIASGTMIIPGVSGSMVLMLMGYYNAIISTIKNLVTALTGGDFQGVLQCCGILVPMGIGIVVGIFGIAKIVELIFEKWPLVAYWAIIGLIVASPIAIVLMSNMGRITVLAVLTSVVTFAAGFFAAGKLGE